MVVRRRCVTESMLKDCVTSRHSMNASCSRPTLNEYAMCYISCYTRIPCNVKCPHVGVFGALGQVLARMRIYDRLQNTSKMQRLMC
eukprot:6183909-Pleurochrysis_carterae.AAC.1